MLFVFFYFLAIKKQFSGVGAGGENEKNISVLSAAAYLRRM